MSKLKILELTHNNNLAQLKNREQKRIVGGDVVVNNDGQILILQFIDLNGFFNTVLNIDGV